MYANPIHAQVKRSGQGHGGTSKLESGTLKMEYSCRVGQLIEHILSHNDIKLAICP